MSMQKNTIYVLYYKEECVDVGGPITCENIIHHRHLDIDVTTFGV